MSVVPEAEWQPTLEELGLDEVEPGIVEDTFANREALRSVGYRWAQYIPEDGESDGSPGDGVPLLQTIGTQEQRRTSLNKLQRKAELMSDPNNAWSDYLPPTDFLADAPVPRWVKIVAHRWRDLEKEGKDPALLGHRMPKRCKVIKRDGTRCWLWAGASRDQWETGMCRIHLNLSIGGVNVNFQKSARAKLMQAAPQVADQLEKLALHAEQESVRLKASVEILDRVGIRGGTEVSSEVTVTHVHASVLVQERLDKLREARVERMRQIEAAAAREIGGDVVEAEIVHDG